jgi:tyrosyl-tRNA synthetase
MMHFLDELHWRGLLYQTTAEDELRDHLAAPGRIGYCGFDPTSDSLTIGNFIPIKLLMHYQRCGHKPIVLMGGGTGLIGDPSGRDTERSLMTREKVEANVASQKRIMERLLDFDPANPNAAVLVNNLDWLDRLGFLQVLRDVGKHFSINEMMQRDSVKRRLEQREQGMSYTEFSYMLLQAYDFLHLRREMNCTCQIAGSDQYGNIVAGIDLIRREFGSEAGQAYGVTAPLVTRSDGAKMSKSTGNAIWLSADTEDRTSPYAFYQYFINLPDADVEQWLKWYTLLQETAIADVVAQHNAAPHERIGQRALAREMTALVHGEAERDRVEVASQALFSGDVRQLDEEMLGEVFADVPSSTYDKALLEGDGLSLVELLAQTTLANSKREARQFLGDGAVSINGDRAAADGALTTADLLHGRTILLRRGKKRWHATQWE